MRRSYDLDESKVTPGRLPPSTDSLTKFATRIHCKIRLLQSKLKLSPVLPGSTDLIGVGCKGFYSETNSVIVGDE